MSNHHTRTNIPASPIDEGTAVLAGRPSSDGRPLSSAEDLLWRIEERAADAAFVECASRVAIVVRARGDRQAATLLDALEQLVERHDVLGMRYRRDAGGRRALPGRFERPVARGLASAADADGTEHLQRLLGDLVEAPFDLANQAPLRAGLFHLSDENQVLALVVHQIACDGWSKRILLRELNALCAGAERDRTPVSLAPVVNYGTYVEWQRRRITDQAREQALAQWRQIDSRRPWRGFAGDGPHAGESDARNVDSHEWTLSDADVHLLRSLARRHRSTMALTMLSVFVMLAREVDGARHLVIGMPISDRRRLEFEGIVGFLMDLLLISPKFGEAATFAEVMGCVTAAFERAYVGQTLPYAELVDTIETAGITDRLCRTVFNFVNAPRRASSLTGLDLVRDDSPRVSRACADLSLHVHDYGDSVSCRWQYRTQLFSRGYIEVLQRRLSDLLVPLA